MTATVRTALASATILALALPAIPSFAQSTVQSSAGAPGPARPAAGVFGCAAGGNQQEIGAVVGGLAGAALGNALSRNNRTIGIVLGGALGAAAGSWIGCRLQISDQQKAQAALERALAENSTQTWRSEIGAASGTVEVVANTVQPVPAGPVAPAATPVPAFAPGVLQLASYDLGAAGLYSARSRTNVRSGPGTGNAVVGQLVAGEAVRVLAQVPGQPWLLVGTETTARGYVSAGLLARQGAGLRTASVPTQPCRTLRETIDGIGDGPVVSTYRGCRNSDGSWTLQSA